MSRATVRGIALLFKLLIRFLFYKLLPQRCWNLAWDNKKIFFYLHKTQQLQNECIIQTFLSITNFLFFFQFHTSATAENRHRTMLLESMDPVGPVPAGSKSKSRLPSRLISCWRTLCMSLSDSKKSGLISFSEEFELFSEITGCVERTDWVEIRLGEPARACCRDVMVFLTFC